MARAAPIARIRARAACGAPISRDSCARPISMGSSLADRLARMLRADARRDSGSPCAPSPASCSTSRRARTRPRARSARRCGSRTRSISCSRRSADTMTSRSCSTRVATPSTMRRRPEPSVRVPKARRQRDHRVVRVPVRAPRRGPALARAAPRDVTDADAVAAHARAARTLYLRRYCAKLSYELELHGQPPELPPLVGALRRAAERRRSGSSGPARATSPTSIPVSIASCYLRAWALETHLRRHCVERFGPRWFESAEAGDAAAVVVGARVSGRRRTSCSASSPGSNSTARAARRPRAR